jgi:hypothetical protein
VPVWHASLALLDMKRRRPTPLASWDHRRKAKARGRALALLAGVGTGPDHWKEGEGALHLRRRLSEAELARLDPGWLALPAIDPG